MPVFTHITNARVVLEDQTIDDGSVLIEGGVIRAVCPQSVPPQTKQVDAHGMVLMPGMIDLHTDAIESIAEPRPGVMVPMPFAVRQADRQSASMGLTTVYHSLSFSGRELGFRNDAMAAELARVIAAYSSRGGVDHRVHARYEVTNAEAMPLLAGLLEEGVCSLVSLMDHTPGQGQFQTMASYRDYLQRRYAFDEAELAVVLEDKQTASVGAWDRAQALVDAAKAHGVAIASHDDDSAERVAMMLELGVSVCEFPINAEAGQAIREAGAHAMVGSPNAFRGGSHSSAGMRAMDALDQGFADCLCSDYVPSTMLPAVWSVQRELGWPLHQTVATVTRHPAEAAGLDDRGVIQAGKRADLMLVADQDPYPGVARVWSAGLEVYKALMSG